MHARLPLPATTRSVADARRFTVETLRDWSLADLQDDAVLVVSELTTNALLHGSEPTELRLASGSDGLRVEVHDGSRLQPRTHHFGLTSTTGRGLRLVAAVASDWGTEASADGKKVWCTLTRDAAAANTGTLPFDVDAVEPL